VARRRRADVSARDRWRALVPVVAIATLLAGCNSSGLGFGDPSAAADLGDASVGAADLPAFCMSSADCPPGKRCIPSLHGCPSYPVADLGGADGGECAPWGDKLGPSCETLDPSGIFDDIWSCQPSTDPVVCSCRYDVGPGCFPL
jgi:hypothetical protein